MTRGKYIVIEGPEGVGKTTQVNLLAERFRAADLPVRVLREPDSKSDLTARAIRTITQDPRYPVNTKTEVLLYNAARSQSLEVIENSTNQGVYCLVDRNYLTTLAVQYYGHGMAAKYEEIISIIKFAIGDMEPDLTVILDAPVNVLVKRMAERRGGERYDKLDAAFLEKVRSGYLWEAKQRNLQVIFANEEPEKIADKVWELVRPVLADRSKSSAASEVSSIKEVLEEKFEPPVISLKTEEIIGDLVEKVDDSYKITEAGKKYLSEVVTNTEGNVYAFTDKLSPTTIAAAMARLSRRADDMRITILDEFAAKIGQDAKLLQRVITAYGDDSVQQLSGNHVVVEGASNLLTKKLEWGRLAAYLEQSTRYIYFDKKDDKGNYKYFMPPNLKPKVKDYYKQRLDQIFDIYSTMVKQLTDYIRENSDTPKEERDSAWLAATKAQACDAIRPVLPVATKSTVGIYGSAQAIESLIMHLQSESLIESREVGQKILDEIRKVNPVFFERADKPDRGGAIVAYRANTYDKMGKLAKKYLDNGYSEDNEPVSLVSHFPRNELDLVPHMLYEHSDMSLEDISKTLEDWPLERKTEVFNAYMGDRLNRRHKPGRALEQAHYSWDLFCDYGIFRDLQRHRMVDNLQWQLLSPRYGFDVPNLVDDALLSDSFQKCFDISLDLYSEMQNAGYHLEAQYATLLGHKMRWQITINAREAFHMLELRTSPQGHPGYRKLCQEMYDKLAEVHPLLASSMKFVNQGEDPELTRLAAEKYTQFKLKQVG
ncbi:MAG TPA: dTMP kinase [Candidatus Saccharimonadales bacterium]|nr:dTMP kinase [Candidatus Saccharimonadales bacterium]